MAAHAHQPTDVLRARVEALAQYGIPQAQIAAGFDPPISEPTLRKYYAEQLARGPLRTNRAVAERLYEFASGQRGSHKEQLTAAIFWAKTRMGWKETIDLNANVTDTDGAAARLAAAVASALAKSAQPVTLELTAEPHSERLN